jgi:hypothetical protein
MTPLNAAISWMQQGFSPVPVSTSIQASRSQWLGTARDKRLFSVQYLSSAPQNIELLLGDKFGSIDVDCRGTGHRNQAKEAAAPA